MQWVLVGCWVAAAFGVSAASPVSEAEVGYICPPNDGDYLDPRSCSQYYECVNGHYIHHSCQKGAIWNPWTGQCDHEKREIACSVYVHPENHWIRHVYYIKHRDSGFTWEEGVEKCNEIRIHLVSVKNWDEDTFLKDYTRLYEHKFVPNVTRQTYWSSGLRTEFSSEDHRDFEWSATGEYMGYSDWCDAGLKTKKPKDPKAPKYPPPCAPDIQKHKCVQFNSSYIESYGWWDASDCNVHKNIICEHNGDLDPTTHVPPPTTTKKTTTPTTTTTTTEPTTTTTTPTTTTTTTPTTTTTTPPTTTSPGPYDGEFLPWNHCEREGYFGYCEKYYSCEIVGPNIIRHEFNCDAGEVFAKSSNSCVPYANGPEECRKPANPCDKAGIFSNRRNCAKFHACVADGAGGFHQMDYRCPDGWLYNYGGTGSQNTCVRPNYDHSSPPCPFAYQICPPVPLDDSHQCDAHGVFRDHVDHHNFLHCSEKLNGDFGQNGPYRCPHNAFYNQDHVKCELP